MDAVKSLFALLKLMSTLERFFVFEFHVCPSAVHRGRKSALLAGFQEWISWKWKCRHARDVWLAVSVLKSELWSSLLSKYSSCWAITPVLNTAFFTQLLPSALVFINIFKLSTSYIDAGFIFMKTPDNILFWIWLLAAPSDGLSCLSFFLVGLPIGMGR